MVMVESIEIIMHIFHNYAVENAVVFGMKLFLIFFLLEFTLYRKVFI